MKKVSFKVFKILIVIYLGLCLLLYLFQEKLIFFPEKLSADYKFDFKENFEEINIKTDDNKKLHGVLFKADTSKGLIFYLHGNAGSIASWGQVAKTYTSLKYDVFLLDYRGFGKSDGVINGQSQLFKDVQIAYNEMLKRYAEDKIIVLGYSIGTGLATKLSSTNSPKFLILQAPYFSLIDMMKHTYPFIPTFILKYKFETNEYIKNCKMPVIIFHGNADEVIYYKSSLKLKELFKVNDTLITLNEQGHNGITDNVSYKNEITRILSR